MSRKSAKPAPFLKWAGGKKRLISQFEPFFPESFDTYIEPFLGGGAIFFHVYERFRPQRIVLSDFNRDLITCYQVVRDAVEPLIERLQAHKERLSKEYYYVVRSQDAEELTPLEQTARLILLNKTCFNGLYRVNRKGRFNVPFGRYKNPRIYDPENLRLVSQILQNVILHSRDFASCIEYVNGKTFVYMDPPYYPLSATANFTSYTQGAFSAEDQQRLAKIYQELKVRGAQVMESNSDCEAVRDLYGCHRLETVYANRAINSRADRRGRISELLILSYE